MTNPPIQSLAQGSDLQLGAARIRPSVRLIEGPMGSVLVEPGVMQVLLAFINARGAVLSHDDLIRNCGSGAIVGEDAVNRAVGEIRRIARATGAGFGVETIPHVGYRLTGHEDVAPTARAAVAEPMPPMPPPALPASPASTVTRRPAVSRRALVGIGVVAGVATAAAIWWKPRREDPEFAALMEKGRQALRVPGPGSHPTAVAAFEAAANRRTREAAAWGLLSLAQWFVANDSSDTESTAANEAAEHAARTALHLDAGEPSALLTQMLLQWRSLDWFAMEQEARRILSIDPAHPQVLDFLVALLQAAGYLQESRDHNERAIGLDGLRPTPQHRKALMLWIMGQPDAADQQAAFTMEHWPLNSCVRNARLLISAFTGRLREARLFLEDPDTSSPMISAPGIAMWKAGLAALESRSAANVARAREACLVAAQSGSGLSAHAVMLLSELREVDAAYEVVEGFILRRGLGWRSAQWLHTPATRPLREDKRFVRLSEVIGLAGYWQQRGLAPDERRALA